MTIVERFARLLAHDAIMGAGGPDSRYGTMERRVEGMWREYLPVSRAALRSVKPSDITDGMVQAAFEMFWASENEDRREAWRRAIAAAIAAGGE